MQSSTFEFVDDEQLDGVGGVLEHQDGLLVRRRRDVHAAHLSSSAVQCSQYSSYVDSSVGVGDMQMVEVREAVEAQRGAAHNEAGARVAAAAGGAGVR